MHLQVLGQPLIILGSYEAARELLDKRSVNYSNRPRSIMAQLYVISVAAILCGVDVSYRTGLDCMTVLHNYGSAWRKHRRAFGKAFSTENASLYDDQHLEAAHRFVEDLIASPTRVGEKIKL